ncbi:MAG: hypothetical protein K1X47_01855 [Cyclobacteriaceae bacterium]|nr:hypothetical protein [Cyclobacteriaceae bacterium]
MKPVTFRRVAGSAAFILVMLLLYLFQRQDWLFHQLSSSETIRFILSRTLRTTVNDLCCVALIRLWFGRPDFVRMAWIVFVVEVCVLLPLYFIFKLSLEGPAEISSPLLSQFHRLLVNPVLMLLLMTGFYLQLRTEKKSA